MKKVAALAAVALLVVVGMEGVSTAAGSAETCRGQAATIIGIAGFPLTGTDGDDVIVTNGARPVHAGGGNDLICVTGKATHVNAGYGDDLVDATERRGSGATTLGWGSDTYLGGPTYDEVEAGGREDPVVSDGARYDGERDVIRTGPGGATVISGEDYATTSGTNDDVIVLGRSPGVRRPNAVVYAGEMGANGRLHFGGGPASLRMLESDEVDRWLVNAGNRVSESDGVVTLRWSGQVRSFFLGVRDARTEVVFLGSSGDDDLRAIRGSSSRSSIRAVMRAGDDRARLGAFSGVVAYGGRGADHLTGGGANDKLYGGAGRDSTNGRGGNDTCQAEILRSCERH